MEGEHGRAIDGCRVPSGRWRQYTERESEKMAYTSQGNGEPGNGKKKCERWNEDWNKIPPYWEIMLENWNGRQLDENYLTE